MIIYFFFFTDHIVDQILTLRLYCNELTNNKDS